MEQFLILNDHTILNPAHAILAGGVLWVYIEGGMTLAEAFEQLSDPEKTCRIEAKEFGTETLYEGYTDLFCITREDDGRINAGLKRGGVNV